MNSHFTPFSLTWDGTREEVEKPVHSSLSSFWLTRSSAHLNYCVTWAWPQTQTSFEKVLQSYTETMTNRHWFFFYYFEKQRTLFTSIAKPFRLYYHYCISNFSIIISIIISIVFMLLTDHVLFCSCIWRRELFSSYYFGPDRTFWTVSHWHFFLLLQKIRAIVLFLLSLRLLWTYRPIY